MSDDWTAGLDPDVAAKVRRQFSSFDKLAAAVKNLGRLNWIPGVGLATERQIFQWLEARGIHPNQGHWSYGLSERVKNVLTGYPHGFNSFEDVRDCYARHGRKGLIGKRTGIGQSLCDEIEAWLISRGVERYSPPPRSQSNDLVLLKQALAALKTCRNDEKFLEQTYDARAVEAAITALRERLAAPPEKPADPKVDGASSQAAGFPSTS